MKLVDDSKGMDDNGPDDCDQTADADQRASVGQVGVSIAGSLVGMEKVDDQQPTEARSYEEKSLSAGTPTR
jgi:hypothetical protein